MAAVVASLDLRRSAGFLALTLAVAACYFAAGRLGLMRQLVIQGAVFTPIWPPTGLALVALLVYGLRCWPGIAIGVLLVIMSITPLRPIALVTVASNTAAPVCAYLMLRRVGFRASMNRLRDGLALVFLGAFGAMLISSITGAGVLVLTDKIAPHSFWPVWLGWWVGDAMGVLLVTPSLLLLRRARLPVNMSRWKEVVGLTAITALVVPLSTHSSLSLLFLVYPLLIWTALSFQLAGSILCALATSVLAAAAATDKVGPFAQLSNIEVMVKLQAFNGSMALTALLLSAMITEQRNTRRSVERACQELAEVLDHLTAGDSAIRRGEANETDGPGPYDTR
ncbi:MASE1 domain-containing protein [Streptomyces sp. MS06]|uniref:MASE1 domain-containing protein n=1 Tax=Streptomyces sp. MS06 TaxID=3385974 RepID=UPI00399F948C